MECTFFIRNWFIRKYCAAQKVEKVQYWVFETRKLVSVYVSGIRFICVQNAVYVMLAAL